jgi:cysteine desulfurase
MSGMRAYLDCNASEVLRGPARAAVQAALELTGNPSSVHGEGRRVRAVIEAARREVGGLVGARVSEIVFTSGASEANSTVMSAGWGRIILSDIEHSSVLAPALASGAEVVRVGADASGVADVGEIAAALLKRPASAGPVLVALQMANNETGVLQPVAETAAFARAHGAFVHCDAVQAAGRVPLDFAALGLDTLAISSHKIGGPKGAGALVVRDGVTIPALIAGGGQERSRRGGTEDVAAIAGFGAAARDAAAGIEANAARLSVLRDRLEREARRLTPEVTIVGVDADRLCNTSCLALPGQSAETLVIKLDLGGVAVSAGAACSSGKVGPSHVLAAMGLAPEVARAALRVSLGHATTEAEIDAFLRVWATFGGTAGAAQSSTTELARGARPRIERVS